MGMKNSLCLNERGCDILKFYICKEVWTLIPTVIWSPKKHRYYGLSNATIQWLCFCLDIGEHKRPSTERM